MSTKPSESSVMFSLQELTRLEDERIEQEARQRAEAVGRAERQREQAVAQAQAAEAARLAQSAAARAQQVRLDAEEAARLKGLEQAAIEQERRDAEGQTALHATEARLRHERELVRLQHQRSHKWYRLAVVVGTAIILGVGGIVAVQATADAGPGEGHAGSQLRLLEEQHQRILTSRRAELERSFRQQRDQLERLATLPEALEHAQAQAKEARMQVAAGANAASLDAFAAALATLTGQLAQHRRRQGLDDLDQVYAELRGTVERLRRPGRSVTQAADRVVAVRQAIEADHPDEQMIVAYDKLLKSLALVLAARASGSGSSARPVVETTGTDEGPCENPNDPLCGKLPGGR